MTEAFIEITPEMIEVGVIELEGSDSKTESALEVVVRIYIAMEFMRLLLKKGVEPSVDVKSLN